MSSNCLCCGQCIGLQTDEAHIGAPKHGIGPFPIAPHPSNTDSANRKSSGQILGTMSFCKLPMPNASCSSSHWTRLGSKLAKAVTRKECTEDDDEGALFYFAAPQYAVQCHVEVNNLGL
ncbi:hypothetical protein TNCV_848781 [Trichonephila clavipes]|uniref:Uncharacterized protein n=1 Tax=Trichonephila clavipes TaxID=2585209 RepID=A0A8X6RHV0_TRICX|nr:hypothetical protein TNCV_848781 [Trichonephila clavipes]